MYWRNILHYENIKQQAEGVLAKCRHPLNKLEITGIFLGW